MSWNPNQPPSNPNPYQLPQQPPIENPYTPQPGQIPYEQFPGAGPFGSTGYQNAPYVSPPASPLSLGQAIVGLPKQYLKILTQPGVKSFTEEQGKAEWSIILVQLIIAGLIGTIIGFIQTSANAATLSSTYGNTAGSIFASFGFLFSGIGALFSLVADTVYFLVIVGIQYLLAKAFKGSGNYEQQGYNFLLFYTPVAIINSLLGWIPYLGGLITFAMGIYSLILNIFSIMAAHRLSGGKAAGVVFIPIGATILLGILFIILFVVWIASLIHSVVPSPTY